MFFESCCEICFAKNKKTCLEFSLGQKANTLRNNSFYNLTAIRFYLSHLMLIKAKIVTPVRNILTATRVKYEKKTNND